MAEFSSKIIFNVYFGHIDTLTVLFDFRHKLLSNLWTKIADLRWEIKYNHFYQIYQIVEIYQKNNKMEKKGLHDLKSPNISLDCRRGQPTAADQRCSFITYLRTTQDSIPGM